MAATITAMTDTNLLRLMTWLSPAFPIGGYTYSHGLEAAIDQGWVWDRESLETWLDDLLGHGAPRNDAIFIQSVYHGKDIRELDELARAFQPTIELRNESLGQGKAFLRAIKSVWPDPLINEHRELTYPIALALAAKGAGIQAGDLIQAYLSAFITNLISAAVRIIPLGQTQGLTVWAAFESRIQALADGIPALTLDDLGGAVMMNDYASMLHETQHTRLFRS